MELRWKDVQLTSSGKYVVAMADAESVRTSFIPFPPYSDRGGRAKRQRSYVGKMFSWPPRKSTLLQ